MRGRVRSVSAAASLRIMVCCEVSCCCGSDLARSGSGCVEECFSDGRCVTAPNAANAPQIGVGCCQGRRGFELVLPTAAVDRNTHPSVLSVGVCIYRESDSAVCGSLCAVASGPHVGGQDVSSRPRQEGCDPSP